MFSSKHGRGGPRGRYHGYSRCAEAEDVIDLVAGEGCGGCGTVCADGPPSMEFVGYGQGPFIQQLTYRYVGYGGDFDVVPHHKDMTCFVTGCCLFCISLLCPLLCWLLWPTPPSYDCRVIPNGPAVWPEPKREYCCKHFGVGCPLPTVTTTMPPPSTTQKPPQIQFRKVDPFNCAIDPEYKWTPQKKGWCCLNHHRGCPPTLPPSTTWAPPPQPLIQLIPERPPPDPYNCAIGQPFEWEPPKISWCCANHHKGCPEPSSPPLFNCEAGFWNWQKGWSTAKKAWCCQHGGKGCPPPAGGCN